MGELPSGAFEQKPPSHGPRSLVDQSLEQAVEVGAAAISLAGKIPGIFLIQGIQHDTGEAFCFRLVVGAHGASSSLD
jgi:hypothetical protein